MIRQVSQLLFRTVSATGGRRRGGGVPSAANCTMSSSAAPAAAVSSMAGLQTLNVTVPKPYVYHVELNRPDKVNALNLQMWRELQVCFDALSVDSDCRVVVLSGSGRLFCGGIDFKAFMNLGTEMAEESDLARKAKVVHTTLAQFQRNLSAIELCNKPVVAAVHNGCIGAGVDMLTATCVRHCTNDAYFQVKEILIGMAADVGTLQRLPKIIGNQSLVRELCYTGRKMGAAEALNCGLVSQVFSDKESLIAGSVELAEQIAKLSPVAVQTTKKSLLYARDHTVQEGLDEIALRNQFLLQSEDFINAVMHTATKQEGDVSYSKL